MRREANAPLEVLLVGRAVTLLWAMPYLMSRCGFRVDVITTSSLLQASRFVRRVVLVHEPEALTATAFAHLCDRKRAYDWVIACEDQSLLELSEMEWPEGREPAYLPLRRPGELSHIYSKIGLSRVLEAAGVRTPPFRVAQSCEEALDSACRIGYPVYVKVDAASGGVGVHECPSAADVMRLKSLFANGPMLVQKKIAGREMDLSAVFFEGRLVHFTCSTIERTLATKALSAVRRYWPLPLVDTPIYTELAALGEALAASGFVSIACMDAADGSGRYFFEADMRPTAWVDSGRLFGDDVSPRIQAWFERGELLCLEDLAQANGDKPVRMAHFQRIKAWEVLLNRCGVWQTIPWAERRIVLTLLGARVWMPVSRKMVPRRLRQTVKRGMMALRIAFP